MPQCMNRTTDKHNVRTLVRALVSHGVQHVVLSPGSRNTPLIVAVAREEAVNVNVVIDERSAAFIALGMAAQSQSPVALICTSGSAVLNYTPAVAEAYYREIPLIIISADRPRQWIDQDDSQTIRQPEILHNIVKHSCDIDVDSSDPSLQRMAARDISDALIAAVSGRPGPVHINIHLDIPLGQLSKNAQCNDPIAAIFPQMTLPVEQIHELATELADKRVLVICGFMSPNDNLSKGLVRLAKASNIAIMHEAQSNVHGKRFIGQIDRTLSSFSEEERITMAPDIVITLGGSLVSRFIKTWLRKVTGLKHWHIGMRGMSVDCFNALSRRIEIPPEHFIPQLATASLKQQKSSDYGNAWRSIAKRAEVIAESYIKHTKWSDLCAMNYIIQKIPAQFNLQLSNGTAIRYVQLFDYSHIHRIDSNRGVSGIDGSTSTAVGASILYDAPTMLVSGDMSAQYDIAALSSELISPRLKIVVLSNGGGGIFHFVDSTKNLAELDRYIACHVNLPLEKLANAYGFAYFRATNMIELQHEFDRLLNESDYPAILEVATNGAVSAQILTDYFKNQKIKNT